MEDGGEVWGKECGCVVVEGREEWGLEWIGEKGCVGEFCERIEEVG